MKPLSILYVARHNNGGNDDEGAIAHALSTLGHSVTKLSENRAHKALTLRGEIDVILFHKWADFDILKRLQRRAIRVCWYFDMFRDWSLKPEDRFEEPNLADAKVAWRSAGRLNWLRTMIEMNAADMLFATDGDTVSWLRGYYPGKLQAEWLPQGFDERCLPRPGRADEQLVPVSNGLIEFYGGKSGGSKRESFVDWCSARWPQRFRHYPRGVHGPTLGRGIRSASVILAPDYPIGHRYWSNRIYLMMGNGALLCHPYTFGLSPGYIPDPIDLPYPAGWQFNRNDGIIDGESIRFYHSRDHLAGIIEDWNRMPPEQFHEMRLTTQQRAINAVRNHHTYRHRVETLLHRVRMKMGETNG